MDFRAGLGYLRGSPQGVLVVKNLPDIAEDIRDAGQIPGSGRFPAGGHGNPLQYSCLVNPMDRGAPRATVNGVTKNWTQPKQIRRHACMGDLALSLPQTSL